MSTRATLRGSSKSSFSDKKVQKISSFFGGLLRDVASLLTFGNMQVEAFAISFRLALIRSNQPSWL